MPLGTIFALYFMLWWIAWLIVLPFGNQKTDPEASIKEGTEQGAPRKFTAWPKLISASILAVIMLLLVNWGVSSEWIQTYWK